MADTAKQLADAEKNHGRLKKLGTREATKEFGSYPKYIDALRETRLKLNDAKADHEDSASSKAKEPEEKSEPVEEKPASKDKEPWEMTKAERGTPNGHQSSHRGAFKTKKDAEAKLAEILEGLDKSPHTKAILDQFGMNSSNTYQVVKSKILSNRWTIAQTHYHEIAHAIQLGKSVPAEVLADYPNLVKKLEDKVEEKPDTPPKEPVAAETGAKGKDDKWAAIQVEPMTSEEASSHLEYLLKAPQKGTMKPLVVFGTKMEESAFRRGYDIGRKSPYEPLPEYQTPYDSKDKKYRDAQRRGWSYGAHAAWKIENPNENKTVSAAAVEADGIKLPEGYIKGSGSYAPYVREQSAPLKPKPDTPPKEPVAEVKEMKEKPEQQKPDLADITPEQDVQIRSEHKKLDKLNDLARDSEPGSLERKAYKEQKRVLDDLLKEAGLNPLPRGQERKQPNRTPPVQKYTVDGGPSSLRQIGVNRSKEERAQKVQAKINQAQANPIEKDNKFPDTSAANLQTGDGGTPTTNPVTGKGADLPGDQKAGGKVPLLKKDLNKVQIGEIYEAKEDYDEALKNLRAVNKGDKLERKKQYDIYIGARKNLSDLRVKFGREALPRTGPINELGKHDGLDEDMIKGVEEHRKAQEEQTASRKPADQVKPAVVPTPAVPIPAAETAPVPPATPTIAPTIPAPAPQRIEQTVTPPRIESIVGSKSPLPQTQPQPQTQAPAPVAPAATVPAPAPQTALPAEAAPTPQPQIQPAPAGAAPVVPTTPPAPAETAPVAPAPWFPLGPGKGQVTWPPQPTAGVAPAPAPSGRGSQAASQAAAASRAKPVNQGQFAPSNPQPQPQIQAPVPVAPATPAPVAPAKATPVPQPVPSAPAPAPPGKQPAPAPAPAQPSQQPAPGQPQQKPGTPQPKPPFNPFQRTEPTPTQPQPKPPFNPFQRIENKVAPRTSRPKQQPETQTQPQPQQQQPKPAPQQPGAKTQPVPVPVPAAPGKPQQEVPLQPMSRSEKVKRALASVSQGIGRAATSASQGIGRAATSASQSVQRVATHGITKAVLAHLGVAALHGINYHKAIKNLGPKQPRKFNPGWHGFTTPVGKPEDEAKADEQQKAAPEPKEAAEPKTSGKWERRDR